MIQYAICWDLDYANKNFKRLFEKFRDLGSNLIFNNLYDFHILEKHSLSFDKSKLIFNELKKTSKIIWFLYSYNISNNDNPRVSINLIISPSSYLRLLLIGYLRSPFYSITIAARDTKSSLIIDYQKTLITFLNENRFLKFKSKKISLIEYESGEWEKKIY